MQRTFQQNTNLLAAVDRLQTLLRLAIIALQQRRFGAAKAIKNASDALETVILTSDEFAVAFNRLQNAVEYAENAERHAAAYELKMVINWFDRRRVQLA